MSVSTACMQSSLYPLVFLLSSVIIESRGRRRGGGEQTNGINEFLGPSTVLLDWRSSFSGTDSVGN